MGVCAFFLADFVLQLKSYENKWGYLKWGWIDLISSIPSMPFLRIGRITRIIRIIRVLRGLRSTRVIVIHLFENRAKGTFATVGIITFVLILFASIAVLNVETGPESSIRTAEDALWWSLATISTVGYGDVYPKTTTGHFIAALLMVAGVALFSTFTAAIASVFVQRDAQQDGDKVNMILKKLDILSERLERAEKTGANITYDGINHDDQL